MDPPLLHDDDDDFVQTTGTRGYMLPETNGVVMLKLMVRETRMNEFNVEAIIFLKNSP
jgi:hypothetical protein